MRRLNILLAIAAMELAIPFDTAKAESRTWSGAGGTADWFTKENWNPNDSHPIAGDSALIQGGACVILSNDTEWLASFTITNAALMFTNWTTCLYATNVTILSNGRLQPITNFYGISNGVPLEMSNRVHVVAVNFTVESNGYVDANGLGYRADNTPNNAKSYGPGAGTNYGSRGFGGSHGGRGSIGYPGPFYLFPRPEAKNPYDSTNAPVEPGSSGGWAYAPQPGAGPGGGAILIEATNVTVNGTIQADGGAGIGLYGGGGSGGSIYIKCGTFDGTGGIVSVRGGARASSTDNGGGAGGRIAVSYTNLASRQIQFRAAPITDHTIARSCPSQMGTLWLPDTNILTTNLTQLNGVRLMVEGFTSWTVPSLTVNSGGGVAFGDGPFALTVEGNLTILTNSALYIGCEACNAGVSLSSQGSAFTTNSLLTVGGDVTLKGGTLTVGGYRQAGKSVMTVGGNLVITNAGKLYVFSGMTNNANPDCGALVQVANDMSVAGVNSWVYPFAYPRTGGVVRFTMNNLTVTNGGFDADYKGFEWETATRCSVPVGGTTTPGLNCGAGSGYGGAGGNVTNTVGSLALGGPAWGYSNAPTCGGSPAGYGHSSGSLLPGGGAVWLDVYGSVQMDGIITANGYDPATGQTGYDGGGSGGGIFIRTGSFAGTGTLRANGGNGHSYAGSYASGGGGGGRIAVWYGMAEEDWNAVMAGKHRRRISVTTNHPAFTGTISVAGGREGTLQAGGLPGSNGTIVVLTLLPPISTIYEIQ